MPQQVLSVRKLLVTGRAGVGLDCRQVGEFFPEVGRQVMLQDTLAAKDFVTLEAHILHNFKSLLECVIMILHGGLGFFLVFILLF